MPGGGGGGGGGGGEANLPIVSVYISTLLQGHFYLLCTVINSKLVRVWGSELEIYCDGFGQVLWGGGNHLPCHPPNYGPVWGSFQLTGE